MNILDNNNNSAYNFLHDYQIVIYYYMLYIINYAFIYIQTIFY